MNKQETVDAIAAIIEDRIVCCPPVPTETAEAIAAQYLLIDRAELPEVVEKFGSKNLHVGNRVFLPAEDPCYLRILAYEYLAAAEHLERRGTEEAKREERRRDIYESLGGDRDFWVHVGNGSHISKAVERIRVLEDGTP